MATADTIQEIRQATTHVLTDVFPNCLATMGFNDSVLVTTENESLIEVCGVRYTLTFAGTQVQFWVGINVRRLILSIFFDRDRLLNHLNNANNESATGEALLPPGLRHGIRGAKHVGYDVHYEEAVVEGRDILSLWMTLWLPPDFLQSPADQVFVGQDIALMMQSLCRAATRDGIKLNAEVSPRPL